MRPISATMAVTISTNLSAAIIFCSHARISWRSGANAEVTLSREAIVARRNEAAERKIPGP
jgi:hypothetical protein